MLILVTYAQNLFSSHRKFIFETSIKQTKIHHFVLRSIDDRMCFVLVEQIIQNTHKHLDIVENISLLLYVQKGCI